MKEKNQPRILVERMKVYRRVPKAYMNKDCNAAIYKSFARFPVKNPHWRYETIEYQGYEFLLESIQEVAYDAKGRNLHCFRETKDEMVEATTVYIPAADGNTVEVYASSNGRVMICTCGFEGNPGDDPNCYWINDGSISGFTEQEYDSCEGESDLTEEEKEEIDKLFKDGFRRQVIEQDVYGKPLKEISWDCDELLDYIEYEYVYAIVK